AAGGAPAPYELTIGTRFEVGLSWLVPSLAPLERLRPERTLHLHFSDGPVLIQQVQQGALDAVITSARLAAPRPELAPLHREDFVFVAAPRVIRGHALRTARDAAAHTLIDASPDLPLFRYFQDAAPDGEAWRFARILYLSTIAAIRLRVVEGAGVA